MTDVNATGGKKRANAVVTTTQEGAVLVFKVHGAGETRLDLNALSVGVKDRAMLHGLVQRVSDRAAISRNPENGQAATPQDKLARMQALVDWYNTGTGEWSPTRTAGGSGGKAKGVNPVVEAVAEIQGVSYAEMMGRIEAACEKRGVGVKAYVNKLATQEQVLARMADIAKRNSSGLDDGDDLMDELMG